MKRFQVKATEVGATMVEYVLLLALIAILCFGVVTALGKQVSCKYGQAASGIQTGGTSGSCDGGASAPTTVPTPTTQPDHCSDGHGHDDEHGHC